MSGLLGSFGEGFALYLVVVTAFVSLLTDRLTVIGALPAIGIGLWQFGFLLGNRSVSGRRRRLPWAFTSQAIRAAMMALIAYIAFQDNISAADRLRSFLLAYSAFSLASGFSSSATSLLTRASLDPADRQFSFSVRSIAGAVLVILSGATAARLLGDTAITTERGFAYLFVASAAAMSAAAFFVLGIREVGGALPRLKFPTVGTPAHDRSVKAFWRFATFRLILGLAAAADVFIVIFAIRQLDMNLSYLGYCIAAIGASAAMVLALWRMLDPRISPRSMLQVGAMCKVVPPLIIVSIPYVQSSATYIERGYGVSTLHWLIVAAFAFVGAATAAVVVGSYSLISSLSSAMANTFTELSNLIMGLVSVSGIAAGWIASQWGFDRLFGLALAMAVLALLASGLVPTTAQAANRATGTAVLANRPTWHRRLGSR